jgi:dTDP-4-dehydrorhamnose 3,5-epimerase
MKIENSEILGLKIIKPNTVHEDFRGKYTELYNKKIFKDEGIELSFIQDDFSYSRKNVLRGIHGDFRTWKLISCLFGAFYLVVIDNQPESKTYNKWEAFTLSEENRLQVLVPPGFGNGHFVLTDKGTIFHYKQTSLYDRSSQFTIIWNDPKKKIFWPTNFPIISERDTHGD